jgi:DNA-binding NarL/FixJ family response regulator
MPRLECALPSDPALEMAHLTNSSVARVVIVEDDVHTLAHLRAAIDGESDFALVAAFDRALPAIDWLKANPADVLLTDLGLPDGSGIDVIRACVAHQKACDIMVITMFGDERNILASIEAGAVGYILKDAERLDIGRAMQDLRAGGSPMTPLIARKVLTRARLNESPSAEPADSRADIAKVTLTNREASILNLIARGYTYEETARLLAVSLSTVQTHIKSIYGKLAVNSRGEAVFEAHKLGLLQDGMFKT